MDNKTCHDLAVAYALAKLVQQQQAHPEETETDSEIRSLLKSYYYALNQLPVEDDDLDEHF